LEPPTLTLFWAGNYGLYVDSKFLNKFRGYVMIRPESLDMPGVFSYEIYDIIHRGKWSIIINGKIIIAIADGHGD
jgi:hypothetical protein